jgi:hypothetical protein
VKEQRREIERRRWALGAFVTIISVMKWAPWPKYNKREIKSCDLGSGSGSDLQMLLEEAGEDLLTLHPLVDPD